MPHHLTRFAAPVAAAIGHLESPEAYAAFISATRGPGLPPVQVQDIDRVIRRLAPMPICNVSVRSPTGATISACYVDAFLLADTIGAGDPAEAIKRVQAAYRVAARSGARLVALGGFSSIIGESAHLNPSREYGIAFTTGNTLTAAVLAEQVCEVVGTRTATMVTVVGAAGDVGSGLCRILHSRGFRLRLVGRRPEPLEALAAELTGAIVMRWDDAASDSEFVVLVSSASLGAVLLDRVPAEAIVLDAGHPPNATAPAGPGPRYIRAGRIRLQYPMESDLPEFVEHYSRGELHACLAEGMTLALEERWESYSSGRGRITAERAAEILGLAKKHGMQPASLAAGLIAADCSPQSR